MVAETADYGMYRLQDDVVQWANEIAINRRPQNTVVKLVGESSELLDAIVNGGNVRDELGDLFILLLDLAHMYDVDLVDAGWEKMNINRHERVWTNDNGVIRRVKNHELIPAPTSAANQTVADLSNGKGPVGS